MTGRRHRNMLPRTGQTASYATGDDGDIQAGLPITTRFVDNGNGTVDDRAQGIMIAQNHITIIPGPVGVHPTNQIQAARGAWATPTAYAPADLVTTGGLFYVCAVAHTSGVFATDLAAGKWRQTIWTASAANLTTPGTHANWAAGVAACLGTDHGGSFEYAGYADWRTMNVFELFGLVEFGKAPSATTRFWTDIYTLYPQYYWTGNTVGSGASETSAWRAWSAIGPPTSVAKTTAGYAAIPVRGGRVNG